MVNKLNPAWLQKVDVQAYITLAILQINLFIIKQSEYIPSTYRILHLTNPEVQILISICSTLPQVEAFYATIINSFGHTLMQIRVDVLGVEVRMLKHSNDLFQLSSSPPVVCHWFELVQNKYIQVCTSMY